MRGSIFSLASVTFGTGFLSFPDAFNQSGPAVGFVILILVAVYSYFTLLCLIKAAFKYKINDYNELVKHLLSERVVIIVDVFNVILILGVIMSYQYNISKFSLQLAQKAGLIFDETSIYAKRAQMALFFVPQVTLSLTRKMSTLQVICTIGTFALIYVILVVCLQTPSYLKHRIEAGEESNLWRKPSFAIFDTVSIFMFGFASHNGIFPVYKELRRPYYKRCIKVLNRSFYLELVLFTLISFCGFFSTFSSTRDIFILRPDLGETDYAMLIGKIALVVTLHCVIAVNFNILRLSVQYSLNKNKELSDWQNLLLTVSTIALTSFLTYFVADMKQIFGIVGGISTVGIAFVIPTLIYVQSSGRPLSSFKNVLAILAMIAVTIVGLCCSFKSVLELLLKV